MVLQGTDKTSRIRELHDAKDQMQTLSLSVSCVALKMERAFSNPAVRSEDPLFADTGSIALFSAIARDPIREEKSVVVTSTWWVRRSSSVVNRQVTIHQKVSHFSLLRKQNQLPTKVGS